VEQVGGGVIGGHIMPIAGGKRGFDPGPGFDPAVDETGHDDLHPAVLLHVLDGGLALIGLDEARIRRLAPHLGVERTLPQRQDDPSVIERLYVLHDRVEVFTLVTLELGGMHRIPGEADDHLLQSVATLLRAARTLALRLHSGLELPQIQRETPLFDDLPCHLHREAVGVVQHEGHAPWEPPCPLLQRPGDGLLDQDQTLVERPVESLFLRVRHA